MVEMTVALVTGGAGFIGSHIVEQLLKQGNHVIVLDDFSSGTQENLAKVIDNKNLQISKGSILDRNAVVQALKGVDVVFHEAAIVSVRRSIDEPITVGRMNVGGTLTLLEESRKASVSTFVFASSCGVYGEAKVLPVNEDSLLAPRNPYAASKAAGEHFCSAYNRTYGFATVCLRYTNVYGPRRAIGPYSGVMVKFAERLASNLPPLVLGDGKQTRNFVYATDVAEATVRSSDCTDAHGRSINIGSGVAISINELAELMSGITGMSHIGISRAEARPGEIVHSRVDTSLAKQLLKFDCKVGLRDGLTQFTSWYNKKTKEDSCEF